MIKEVKAPGICCTCNSRKSCLSLGNSLKRGEAIQYCETFDDSETDNPCPPIDAKERRLRAHAFNQPINFEINI